MTVNLHRSRRPHTLAQHAERRPRARNQHDPTEPWRVVELRRYGLLRYARARGTMALPVEYAICEHRIHLRLPAYNDASHFLDRADVALDVDASTVGRQRTVRVTGVGLVVPCDSVPEPVAATLEPWPEQVPTTAVIIVPESVRWLTVVDDLRDPPLPGSLGRLPATFS